MRTRLSLRLDAVRTIGIVVTTDAAATVGDVADALSRARGRGIVVPETGSLTLAVEPPEGGPLRTAHRAAGVPDAGLRAGSTIELVAERPHAPTADRSDATARLRVVSGPDAGLVVDLPVGVTTVGRGPASGVRLTDPLVSTVHARVHVGDQIEIVDAGSSNGVLIDGGLVERVAIGPQDVPLLGSSGVTVERLQPADTVARSRATVAFNRSPRVVAHHPEREVEAPKPPEPARPGRFPVIALVAPLLMGTVLFLATHNALSLVFVALSPILMIGTYLDKRWTDRARVRTQTAGFRTDLAALDARLATAQAEEQRTRLGEAASAAEGMAAATALGTLLWSRRPEHEDFLTVRVGVGSAASRTTVRLPARGTAVHDVWADLESLAERYATVPGVPTLVSLRDCGALGLAGPRDVTDAAARAVVLQLICLHSPAELVVAGIASAASSAAWSWLTWLPHTSSPHSPLGTRAHLASHQSAGTGLVTALEQLVADRRSGARGKGHPLPAVLLVVEDDAPVDRGRLVRLAEDGSQVGVHLVWCAAEVSRLPAVCRAFLSLGGSATVGLVRDGTWSSVQVEVVDLPSATAVARRLAAVVDAGAPVIDASDVPRSVSYLALAGPELATDPGAVLDRWRETGSLLDRSGERRPGLRPEATLRALVGQGAEREFVLDLRAQGPHALVGGTTGAGKSEFLQAWVLGLAAAHSPDRVTFLFVDYKGGAAFAECVDLPHCVGLVTDLSPHLVRRALTSLRAELRHREALLVRKKAKDLLALERAGDPETPPALVIVVDEFAALVSEVPEFVDGVVDVAQRGRSLGLHLILATQRPAGVIKDNLRANTNLRIALRTADEHDSTDVVGSPLAAGFDPGVPGRGVVRTGPGRIAMFQTGYVGGRSDDTPPSAVVEIESLGFGPGEVWDIPPAPGPSTAPEVDGPADIARVVATIGRAAASAAVPEPRRPWLPELATVYDLAALGPCDDSHLAIGTVDLPTTQEQALVTYQPDDGALIVYGTGGSGTSTLLRTVGVGAGLATMAAQRPGSYGADPASPGGPVHVYGLDFGSGGLAMLSGMPHVGAVIGSSDRERVARLLRRLRDTVDERSVRYAQVRAGSVGQYRALADRPDEPRILLLLDGLSAFRDAYEAESGRGQVFAAFQRVVAEGRPLGVHVVMSAERPGALPTSLAGSVPRRLVLRQADESAYSVLDVPKDAIGPRTPPGRGVLAGTVDEVQVAVVGGTSNPAEQGARIEELTARMRAAGVEHAPPVRRLPSFVALSGLPPAVDAMPVLGLADDTLEPIGFAPDGTFLVAGLPGSGRTTVLGALSASLRRFAPQGRLYYVGSRRSPVHAAGVWTGAAVNAEEAADLARSLLPELREPPTGGTGIVLVIESITDLLGGPAEQVLTEAVKAARRNEHFVLAESETSTWGSAWPLVAEIRNARRGLVLQPDHLDGDALFRTPFPRMARAEFPPGRGMVVEHGRARRVQVPVAD